MKLSNQAASAVFTLLLTQALALSGQAQTFQSQTTYDPDAASRRAAGSVYGIPTRSSGGIRTTPRTGSSPVRRPAPRTSRPATPRPTATRPIIKPQVRPAARPQPIKIGLYHRVGEFAPPREVSEYNRAKRDEVVYAGHLRRIKRDFERARKQGNQRAMQILRNHYAHSKRIYDQARDYRTRAGRVLNQKFAIHFSGDTLSKRHAFYAQLRQQVARYPALNGKPFSILIRNGRVQVVWYPGGRVNYGGKDVSHLFRL